MNRTNAGGPGLARGRVALPGVCCPHRNADHEMPNKSTGGALVGALCTVPGCHCLGWASRRGPGGGAKGGTMAQGYRSGLTNRPRCSAVQGCAWQAVRDGCCRRHLPRCEGSNLQGLPCGRAAMPDGRYCGWHDPSRVRDGTKRVRLPGTSGGKCPGGAFAKLPIGEALLHRALRAHLSARNPPIAICGASRDASSLHVLAVTRDNRRVTCPTCKAIQDPPESATDATTINATIGGHDGGQATPEM